LGYLNRQGIKDVYLFDDLPNPDQFKNLVGKQYLGLHSTKEIVSDLKDFDCVVHIGANANTLETDWSSIYYTNVSSTRRWHDLCRTHGVPFIFTSSAAVYGNGEGPLNQYAFSKLVSEQEITHGAILRLFNVYGPNERHKGRMASTIYHWHNQLQKDSVIKVFEGSENYHRDFIYVEDVARVIYHFIKTYQPGIYDVGTGTTTDFLTLSKLITDSTLLVSMPEDLKAQYQTYTKANTAPLTESGFDVASMRTVKAGVEEYLEYLKQDSLY
jgi:ADP-L-glycero-D-manno-heptose 6-epimerase